MDSQVSQTHNPSPLATDEQTTFNHDDDRIYTRLDNDLFFRLEPEGRKFFKSLSAIGEGGGK